MDKLKISNNEWPGTVSPSTRLHVISKEESSGAGPFGGLTFTSNGNAGICGFDYTVRDLVAKYVDDPEKQCELELEIFRLIERKR